MIIIIIIILVIIKDSLTFIFNKTVLLHSVAGVENPLICSPDDWLCKHDNNPNTWFADRDLVYSK